MKDSIIVHSFSNSMPDFTDIRVGELALWIEKVVDEEVVRYRGRLFSKNFENKIVELSRELEYLEDLKDVEFINVEENDFIVRRGNKWINSKIIGSLTNLSDVEINNPESGEYLRYDDFYKAFSNYKASYNLYQLLDVEVEDGTDTDKSLLQDNKVLYYDASESKFKLRDRFNLINQLDDVSIGDIPANEPRYQLLTLDLDGIWKNMPLKIERDLNPSLGNHLDANGYQINNSTYRVNSLICDTATKNLSYELGDYWIIEGVDASVNNQCIINIQAAPALNSSIILLLEVRQRSGNILIGNIVNPKYENGVPLNLSGAGCIDLITLTIVNQEVIVDNTSTSEITTYVTANALNLATNPTSNNINRYDKNRYPDTTVVNDSQFSQPSLYDEYFKYVELLLNFEPQISKNLQWYEDKSSVRKTVTTNTDKVFLPLFYFGIQESIAKFNTTSNFININSPISLPQDFTIEFFINYPLKSNFISESTSLTHTYFSNQDNSFSIKYLGLINSNQNTRFEIKIGTNVLTYINAYMYFINSLTNYIHIAVVRYQGSIKLYINGVEQVSSNSIGVMNDVINISSGVINMQGNLNSFRISSMARYVNNFKIVPSFRFGLVSGADNILDGIIYNSYYQLSSNTNKNYIARSIFAT